MSRSPARDAWSAGTGRRAAPRRSRCSSANSSTPPSSRTSSMRGRLPSGSAAHQAHAGPRDQQAERAADGRQHEALGEHLPHQLHASRAKRRAHRNLAAAAREPRQHQVRDVGADDQQQESDRGRNQQQRRTHRGDQLLLRRDHARAPAGVAVRERRRQPAGDDASSRAAPAPAATPSASRPTTLSDRALRERPCASFGSKLSGVQMSTCALGGKSNAAGITPIDRVRLRIELDGLADCRSSSRRSAAPRRRGSAPRRDPRRACLRRRENVRPSIALARSTVNRFAVPRTLGTSSGSPSPANA